MTIAEIQQEIVDDYALFDDEMDRYEYLIDEGKKLAELPEAYRLDKNLVQGCTSKVWLHGEQKDGKMFYYADSNTAITKGIVALLLRVANAQSPSTVANLQFEFIEKSGLKEHLSSQRSNGLLSMIQQLKKIAKENNLPL